MLGAIRRLTPLPAVFLLATPTFAQLPFGVTESDVLAMDTAAVEWLTVRTHVGGAEARLSYSAKGATVGECKAAAVIGALRLRDHYIEDRGLEPVTLRLTFDCGRTYGGNILYNGVVTLLELRNAATGEILYRDSEATFP